MDKRRLLALTSAGLLAGIVAGPAAAAVFAHILRASADRGELVAAQVDA